MERLAEQKLAESIDADIQIKQVKIGKYDINYAQAGSGPPILLIHGGNIGWGQWYPNIPALANHFTVYAIDLPGGGRSTRLDFQQMDLEEDLVKTVEGFIDKNTTHPLYIVGSSIGGWIALRLALDQKERVSKLILLDSLGFSNQMRIGDRVLGIPFIAKVLANTILKPGKNNKNIEKFLRSVFDDKQMNLPAEFIDYFYETMESSHNLLFISRFSSFWGMRPEFIMKDKLTQLSSPTLIIWGDSDPYMPIVQNQPAIQRIPQGQLHILKNAGHIPSIEKSQECNDLMIDFLQSDS